MEVTIKQVELTDTQQLLDPCKSCMFENGHCMELKSYLKNELGFKDCNLGVNYQVVKNA